MSLTTRAWPTASTVLLADSKYRIAEIHEKQGNLKEAKAIFLECGKIYSKVFGDEHERTLDTRTRAATVGQQAE